MKENQPSSSSQPNETSPNEVNMPNINSTPLSNVNNANGVVAEQRPPVETKVITKAAETLIEQVEYFKVSYKIRASHVLWLGLTTIICYDRYQAYSNFREKKSEIFGRNRKSLQQQFGALNSKYTLSNIHPRGDPDKGDWAYFAMLPEADQQAFLLAKARFQDQSVSFNSFMPLYITAGIYFPLTAACIGFLFRRNVFVVDTNTTISKNVNSNNSQNGNKNNLEINNQDSTVVVRGINATSDVAALPQSTDNAARSVIETKEEKKEGFFAKVTSNSAVFMSISSFAISSSILILKSFL